MSTSDVYENARRAENKYPVFICPACARHNPPEYEQCWKCNQAFNSDDAITQRQNLAEQKQLANQQRIKNTPYKGDFLYQGVIARI